jgi:hypothetical protein
MERLNQTWVQNIYEMSQQNPLGIYQSNVYKKEIIATGKNCLQLCIF